MARKQYKPGQFVWIDGKKYRVTKTQQPVFICGRCPLSNNFNCTFALRCILLLPNNCYPKPV